MSSKSLELPSATPADVRAPSLQSGPKGDNASIGTTPKASVPGLKPSDLPLHAKTESVSRALSEENVMKTPAKSSVLGETAVDNPSTQLSVKGGAKNEPKPDARSNADDLSNPPSPFGSKDGNPIPTPEREMSREKNSRRERRQSHDSLHSKEEEDDHRHRRNVHDRPDATRSGSYSRDDTRSARHRRESPRNSSRRSVPRHSDYRRRRSRSRSRSRSRDRSRSPSSSYDSRRRRRGRSRSSSDSRDYSSYSRSYRRRGRSRSWDRRRSPSSSRSRSPRRSYYRSPSRRPRSRRDSPRSRRDYGYRRSYPSSERNWSPRNERSGRYISPSRNGGLRWHRRDLDDGSGYSRRGRDKKRRRTSEEAKPDEAGNLRTVFVWRLVQRVNESDVYAFFSRAGKVRDVRLVMDRRSSRHKGAGYVEFYSQDSVKRAVALAGGSICGFPVAVKPSLDEKTTMIDNATRTTNAALEQPAEGSAAMPTGPVPTPSSSTNVAGGQVPLAAVGWSMTARQPVRQVSHPSVPANVGGGAASVPTELVSVKELAAMLNPNNLPIPPAPTSGTSPVSPAKNLSGSAPPLEQVPLPTTANCTSGPAKAGTSNFTRLYVGSVPFQLTESDLHAIFDPFGTITSLQLQRDPATGRSRGYGFVEYADHDSAKKALGINGIDLGGRPLKVALASHDSRSPGVVRGNGISSSGGGVSVGSRDVTGELDEGREGGVLMNASQKALLRERLSRGQSMVSDSLSAAGAPWSKALDTSQIPSKSLLLSNMFDPSSEPTGFEQELAEDVRDECVSKYGTVTHLYVDKLSRGLVYIRFASVDIAQKAMISLNGRWFGGQRVSAAYIADDVYRKRFAEAPV